MNNIIYLDNAATTKVDKEVLETYNKVSTTFFANTSSIHSLGYKNNDLLEKARASILSNLNLKDDELIFTSGATESNNLAIKGYALKHKNRGNHIIVSSIEHPSVLECAKQLESEFGFNVTYLPVKEDGKIDINTLKEAIRKETILVSIMSVNNETGVIEPIEEIASLLKGYNNIVFHVDAVQSIGKVDINLKDVDMITLTSHKINGLKGIGALIKKKNISLLSLNTGGGQENNLRSGTYDLANIVSFAKAIDIAIKNQKSRYMYVKNLSDILYEYFLTNKDEYHLNSNKENPYIVNVSLLNKKASVIVEGLSSSGVMVSSISACHSKGEPFSYVVMEMSHNEKLARNTLRISLSHENTKEEIEEFIAKLTKFNKEIRQ